MLQSHHRLMLLSMMSALLAACASSHNPAPIVDASHSEQRTRQVIHSAPRQAAPNSLAYAKGSMILRIAQSHIGTPYRYGGDSPQGFDCSGLVQYSHKNAGIAIPRTAHDQYKAATPVRMAELQPGDVIFFRQNFRRVSHVGIYAGQGKFIHAPNSGKRVKLTALTNPYWSKRIVQTGRFY